MKRLILLSHPPGLASGRWDIELISAADASDLIASGMRQRIVTSLIAFPTTIDVLCVLTGYVLKRAGESNLEREHIAQQPGDVFLVVLLNRRGKAKPRGSDLDSSDLDFYKIEIS